MTNTKTIDNNSVVEGDRMMIVNTLVSQNDAQKGSRKVAIYIIGELPYLVVLVVGKDSTVAAISFT